MTREVPPFIDPEIAERSRRWVGLSGPPHEIELFRRVVADPRDREARRAYAAELCRAGEPRGEYIALEEARMDAIGTLPSRRATSLYEAHAGEWFGEIRRFIDGPGGAHGGFVENVFTDVRRAALHGADLAARTPMRWLALEGARWPGDGDGLFDSSWTEHVEKLSWHVAFENDLIPLGNSRHLRNVTSLYLSNPQLSVAAARALASGALPALRELSLVGTRAEPGAFDPIATLPLTTLVINGSPGFTGVLEAIGRSPAMSSLRCLRIGDLNGGPSDTLEALAASPYLGALEEIELGVIDEPSASYYPEVLFRSPQLRSLKLVTATGMWATDPSGDMTIETPHGPATFRRYGGSQYY